MTTREVFSNPTVYEVVFQVRFPNLFYLESRVGDFQRAIIERFPESEVIYRQPIVVAEIQSGIRPELMPEGHPLQRIWQFKSQDGVSLSLMTDSLALKSGTHKTYDHPGSQPRFRDAIEFAVDSFIKVIAVPLFTRIGLRYKDRCPIPNKTSKTLLSYYNSTFPVKRFALEEASEMEFKTVVKRGRNLLRYMESLKSNGSELCIELDFDGFVHEIKSADFLIVADDLHDMISKEYFKTIKQPVIDYMRKKPGSKRSKKNAAI